MYRVGESFIFSPSDLTAFLECEHLTQLERLVSMGEIEKPVRDDPEGDLLSRYGDEHEHEELERLEASGMSVARIEVLGHMPDDLRAAEAATLAAIREGVSVIYQASFFDGMWRGQADFLFRVDAPSDLGSWSYEVADTKLARRAKPSALVQMACYSEQIARLQGVWPEEMTVISGDGVRHRFLVSEVTSYVRFAKQRLIDAVIDDEVPATYPTPVNHCRLCPWDEVCDERRREDDHLSLVARMRGDGVVKLQRAGVSTMGQLARLEPAKSVRGMGAPTVERLYNQARLQVAHRDDGVLRYELLETQGDRQGLAGLPLPSHGDLFVDFEGDPWVGEHGLEYLFGVLESPDASSDVVRKESVHQAPAYKAPAYQALWAHDFVGEKAAFEAFVDLIIERLDADPKMHVYHYAPYEVQAMKKLMSRYATREAQVDHLLRAEVMVDLYRVVSQGVRVSLESYGLKKLEPFYWPQREGAISDGAASVTAYEIWREIQDDETLQELQDYNELDCRSTLALRDWLETLRSELETVQGGAIPRFDPNNYESPEAAAKAEAQAEDLSRSEQEASELVMSLLVGVPAEPEARTGKQQAMWLLAQLVGWHRREAKPKWWAWFDRLARTDEELVTDTESIGELTYMGELGAVKQSIIHRYAFDPVQEHKIKTGDNPTDPLTQKGAGEVHDLDQQKGLIDFKRGKNSKTPHPRSLIPARPFGDQALRMGVVRVA
ncbi:MAG: TM0106 family RecB-like putative nuclease, partial [Acidimicrobiales bacterium]